MDTASTCQPLPRNQDGHHSRLRPPPLAGASDRGNRFTQRGRAATKPRVVVNVPAKRRTEVAAPNPGLGKRTGDVPGRTSRVLAAGGGSRARPARPRGATRPAVWKARATGAGFQLDVLGARTGPGINSGVFAARRNKMAFPFAVRCFGS
jgi:hypothetical protein